MSQRNSSLRCLLAAAGAAVIAGLASSTPARALDDGSDQNIFETVKGFIGTSVGFGLSGGDEKPRIDYRERAPLVLPPSAQLPQPVAPVAQRNSAWPKDYDAERARRTGPALGASPLDVGMSAQEVRTVGRLGQNAPRNPAAENCSGGIDASGRVCDQAAFWRVMKTTSPNAGSSGDLVAGQEPPRARLTDPPTGFRAARKSQKYTFEIQEKPDLSDPRAQLREERRRESQVD